jgi:alpha-maltose-1-phosphate synthase
MTVAIYYTATKLTKSQEIFGLQMAVEGWLKAWFRYGAQSEFHFLIGETAESDQIQSFAKDVNLDPARLVKLDRRFVRENLTQLTTVFRLNPDPQPLLWQRTMLSSRGFNFCGLAHAITGTAVGQVLEQYCLGPSEKTDVIVCPSRAVRSGIQSFWETYSDYLHQRFGTQFKCSVQLPIIPLGVYPEQFKAMTTPDKRQEQRQKLNLSENDFVVLWVGRLSVAIKTHPLAMFQAVERAAEMTGARVHFIMVGYFMPAEAEAQFNRLANDVCSKAKVTFIANNDPRFPDGLWAAGDMFLSLIDNMQESFGLTPIEAMAAGLPRVISDWNGYRDSVHQGEDGLLVRTVQPPPGNGRAFSELLLDGRDKYGGFLAKSALTVAIDQTMAAEAIALLIKDKNKRKSLAEKASKRVLASHDWKHIIPAYEALWEEMAIQKQANIKEAQPAMWPSAMPQVPDPFTMYASYASASLKESDRISVIASPQQISNLWKHEINIFACDIMMSIDDAMKVINHISQQGDYSIGDILRQFSRFDRARIWRSLAWLIKLGILRVQ